MLSATQTVDRQSLICSRLDYVRFIALSIHAQYRVLPVDDLVGWGCLGLVDACDRIDSSMTEESFEAYCKCKIRGAMLDQIRRECARRESAEPEEWPAGMDAAFERIEVAEVLNQLPTKERQVIYLRLEGYTQEDVGRALTIGRDATARLERRAIASMRKLLRQPRARPLRIAA